MQRRCIHKAFFRRLEEKEIALVDERVRLQALTDRL
jgi:hypothetical protein